MELNGSSGYISIADVYKRLSDAQFTVAMWVYPTTSVSGKDSAVISLATAGGVNVCELALDKWAMRNRYFFKDGGKYATSGTYSKGAVPKQQWHWVALTVSEGKVVKVYMGSPGGAVGKLILTVPDATLPLAKLQSAEKFSIGTKWTGTTASSFLAASIDNLRIWDVALTVSELNFFMKVPTADPTSRDNIHLVGYFALSEAQGESIADTSSGGLTGTLHNAHWVTTYTVYDKLPPVDDSEDFAVMLDGKAGYVAADDTNFELSGKALSVFGWVYPVAAPSGTKVSKDDVDGCVFAFNTQQGGNLNQVCYNTHTFRFFYKDASKTYSGSTLCDTEVTGKWWYVGFTIDNDDNGVLFINGEPQVTFKSHTRPAKNGHFSIGQEWDGDARFNADLRHTNHFRGKIDEVSVWNRVLSQEEIQANVKLTHLDIASAKALVGYWPFDEGAGFQTADKSGFKHNAMLRTGVSWEAGRTSDGSSRGFFTTLLYVIGAAGLCYVCVARRDRVLDGIADAGLDRVCSSGKGYRTVSTHDDDREADGLLDDDDDLGY